MKQYKTKYGEESCHADALLGDSPLYHISPRITHRKHHGMMLTNNGKPVTNSV